MMVQAAVIQVHRAHRRPDTVGDKHLGMNEPRRVLVALTPRNIVLGSQGANAALWQEARLPCQST